MREPYLHWKDEMPHVKTKNPVGIDFVVIKVLEPFVFNHIVMGACLPSEPVKPGSDCHASGWGSTKPIIFGNGKAFKQQVKWNTSV